MMRRCIPALCMAVALALSACASQQRIARLPRRSAGLGGRPTAIGTVVRGLASWYGPRYHGRRTASGERFDQHAMTAAHRRLSLGTFVKVTRQDTGHSVVVRINDRGPFVNGVIIDLSREAARRLRFLTLGRVLVTCEVVGQPTDPTIAAETTPSAAVRQK